MKFVSTFLVLAVLLGAMVTSYDYRALIATNLAATTMRAVETVVDKVPRSQCKVCNGTGKVKAGDTVTVVWYDCTACYADTGEQAPNECEPNAEDGPVPEVFEAEPTPASEPEIPSIIDGGRQRRVLMLTADWCTVCKANIGDLKPWSHTQTPNAPLTALKIKQWSVGSEPSNQFQVISTTKYPEIAEYFDVKVWPTYVCLVDGVEAGRLEGAKNAFALADLYNSSLPGAIGLGKAKLKDQVRQLKSMLQYLGGDGTISISPSDNKQIEYQISANCSLLVKGPLQIKYTIVNDVITLHFSPAPTVKCSILKGNLNAIDINTDRLSLKIGGLPDGFFEIN